MAKQKVMATRRVGLRYIGNGAFLPGLPARNMGAADLVEYATLIGAMEQAGTLGALYESVEEQVDSTSVRLSAHAEGSPQVEEGTING